MTLSLLEKLHNDIFGKICSYLHVDKTLVALFATSETIRKMLIAVAPSIPIPYSLLRSDWWYLSKHRKSRLISAFGLIYIDQRQLEGPINHEPNAKRLVIEGAYNQAPIYLSRLLKCVDLTKITVLKLGGLSACMEDVGSQVGTLPNLKVLNIRGAGFHGDVLKRLAKLTELTVVRYNNDLILPGTLRKLTLTMDNYFPGLALPTQLIELNLKILGMVRDNPPNQEKLELVIPNSCLKTLRLDFERLEHLLPDVVLGPHPSTLTRIHLRGRSYHKTLLDSSPLLEVIEYIPRELGIPEEVMEFIGLLSDKRFFAYPNSGSHGLQ